MGKGLNTNISDATPSVTTPILYAHLWRRLFALFVDFFVIFLLITVALYVVSWYFGIRLTSINRLPYAQIRMALGPLAALIIWFYFAGMESSKKQATIGKMLVGINVVDKAGLRVSFGRATGRYFGKYLSTLTLGLGYFGLEFNKTKQAIHDFVSGTFVVLQRQSEASSVVSKNPGLTPGTMVAVSLFAILLFLALPGFKTLAKSIDLLQSGRKTSTKITPSSNAKSKNVVFSSDELLIKEVIKAHYLKLDNRNFTGAYSDFTTVKQQNLSFQEYERLYINDGPTTTTFRDISIKIIKDGTAEVWVSFIIVEVANGQSISRTWQGTDSMKKIGGLWKIDNYNTTMVSEDKLPAPPSGGSSPSGSSDSSQNNSSDTAYYENLKNQAIAALDAKHQAELQELNIWYSETKQAIDTDYGERGMLHSGGYLTAIANLQAQYNNYVALCNSQYEIDKLEIIQRYQ